MKIDADGFSFDFTDAINAFIFDERDRSKPTFHGQPMKAVDIVAELPDAYVFVEMKHFHEPESYNIFLASDDEDTKIKNEKFKRLKNYLKYKYRDSYLFRHAEGKADKPIHYICLLTFDNSLNGRLQKSLKQELPVGKASTRWLHGIAESCHVLNVNSWNRNFPKWPVTHLAGNA